MNVGTVYIPFTLAPARAARSFGAGEPCLQCAVQTGVRRCSLPCRGVARRKRHLRRPPPYALLTRLPSDAYYHFGAAPGRDPRGLTSDPGGPLSHCWPRALCARPIAEARDN